MVHWGWGGARPGAGRKRAPNTRRAVVHRVRPPHRSTLPSHVTVSVLKAVGDLRRERIFKALKKIFHHPQTPGFQVVHYSVQKDHLHLVVEASNRGTFSSGMRSLGIRVARRLNRLLGRRGKVLRDRYHRRDLFSARQVRRVLVYVLLNGAKHKCVPFGQLDSFSSSWSFDGWRDVEGVPHATGDPPRTARTSLLLTEWRELGLISPEESIRWALPPRPPGLEEGDR
jgi:hypothetical protein